MPVPTTPPGVPKARWIRFDPVATPPSRKTKVWQVTANQGNMVLGVVLWSTGWRRYVFAPYQNTSYEQDCLRDIASFVEDETRKHKNARVPADDPHTDAGSLRDEHTRKGS